VLVLGSFPSVASFEKGEYYGNVRNHFWTIAAALLGAGLPPDYAGRVGMLARAGIAVWDVIASCEREGSLDQAIRDEEANDIAGFLAARSSIVRVALNGGKAADSFCKKIAPELPASLRIGEAVEWRPSALPDRSLLVARLPSTSPVPTRGYRGAGDKLAAWRAFLVP